MNYRDFESFKTPDLNSINEVTPTLFLDSSGDFGKTIVYVIHTDENLLALGVDIEEATDPFYIDDGLKEELGQCYLCGATDESLECLELASLDSEKYSVSSFKGDGLRLDEEEVEFADIKTQQVCERCYLPLIDCLSDWMEDHSTDISSYII